MDKSPLISCNISYINAAKPFSIYNLRIFENEPKTSPKVETHVIDMAFHLSTD